MRTFVERLEAAVIGTGWCGGIRAETLSRSALPKKLHICEIRPDRLAEVKALTNPATATLDYQDIVKNPDIKVVYISTTPEQTHFPIARDCLRAGKHVLLEKPIALEFWEADELITLARRAGVKFTIGYSQRFNPKIAYAKKKIADGTLGKPVSVMVSIGGGWNLPPSYPNYCATWIEITGSDGSLFLDDSQRDNWLSTVSEGTRFPMSTMPGEQVDHVFAGQMGPETIHFLESCILDRPVMVKPEHARMVMETYLAADLSAERNEPIDLPLSNETLSAVTEMTGAKRAAVG
jgi:predicted dehydrogenase